MAQHQESFGLECGTCSAVAAGVLHEVILLGDRGHLSAPWYVRSAPWPENIHAAIAAEGKRRKAKKLQVRDTADSDGAQ